MKKRLNKVKINVPLNLC